MGCDWDWGGNWTDDSLLLEDVGTTVNAVSLGAFMIDFKVEWSGIKHIAGLPGSRSASDICGRWRNDGKLCPSICLAGRSQTGSCPGRHHLHASTLQFLLSFTHDHHHHYRYSVSSGPDVQRDIPLDVIILCLTICLVNFKHLTFGLFVWTKRAPSALFGSFLLFLTQHTSSH